MGFIETAREMADEKFTLNGAKAYNTTGGGKILDLFSTISTMRKNPDAAATAWKEARNEDKELADNLILYTRDIRNGGIGEREIGRRLLLELAKEDPNKVKRNFETIVNTGRWDDLFVLFNTPLENDMIDFIKEQWTKDLKNMNDNKPISLLSKWLPSINTSSDKTRYYAKKICNYLHLSQKTYRKTLSIMRNYLKVVEKQMSARDWNKINFEAVPSKAMLNYQNCFERHCEHFTDYVQNLKEGKAKINSSTLYPYEICKKFFTGRISDIDEEAWKALPNFISEDFQVVIMADVSGSMTWDDYKPIATSVGLATYFAQRNKGKYHNMYLTFSQNPEFIFINDNDSLKDIFKTVYKKGVGYNTNLDAAFAKIFNAAKKSRELPKALVVISDQEIDYYVNQETENIVEKWNRIFKEEGFDSAPKTILWNVSSFSQPSILAKHYQNVSYVCGYGIGPFQSLKTLIEKSAYEAMVEILTKPQFSWR